MQLRLSIATQHQVRTVSIRAAPGTPWLQVRQALGLAENITWAAEYADATVPLRADTPLGTPPLVHGATLLPAPATTGPQRTTPPVILTVSGGPDAGAQWPLPTAASVSVGRGQWCDVVVEDPGLSRCHFTLSTTRRGIVVQDGDSTNGTRLDTTVLTEPTIWPPGVVVHAGASTFELVPATEACGVARANGHGRLVLASRSQEPAPHVEAEFEMPARTTPTAPVPPGALGWLLPLAVSILLAVLLSMPTLMLFGLMAPAMSLGGHLGDRRRYRRECATAEQNHRHQTTAVRRTVEQAVHADRACRQERVPDLARLLAAARRTDSLVWSRDVAQPVVRLGRADQPTRVVVAGTPEEAPDLPLEINLRHGVSIIGPPEVTRAAARSLLVQLAVLHGPARLGIRCTAPAGDTRQDPGRVAVPAARPADPGPLWDWLAWLPHTRAPHPDLTVHLHDLTLAGPQTTPAPAAGPETTIPERLTLSTSADTATTPTAVPITLCHTESQAPDGSLLVGVEQTSVTVLSDTGPLRGTPDLLSAHEAERAARLLAPLTDGAAVGPSGSIPTEVDLASVAPVPLAAEAIADRWRRQPRSTRCVLGRDSGSVVEVDLATDGPHALVAGTTGSGKSELLRTLVTSLSLVNRPDELVMVLVDYKGGSAFAEASGLPHVVGVITDLDPHLADRALTSLTAELKRRERILAAAGVPDLPAYQEVRHDTPMPRLVIVIDEFRALAEELPDFLDGLVHIAALGRSLGVHLVLATQRPSGVVSADVRANVNLRIALRVRDASDSYDVIDSPAGADLPEGVPGRALIRTGADEPRTVQVASSSTSLAPAPGADRQQISILLVSDLWEPDVHPSRPGTDASDGPSVLACVTEAATTAAQQLGAQPPPSPWLPALPEVVSLPELTTPDASSGEVSVPLMLADLPAEQRQPVLAWTPLHDGHLGIAGAPRSGRSTALRTVLAGILRRDPAETHLYVFDLAGSLGPIAEAPHTGAALAADDVARGCRVIEYLAELVASRQRALAAAGFTSLAEQRASSDPWPVVVLAIDGWPRFVETYGETDRGRPLERVLQVLREGLAAGVVAVLSGDRSLFGGRIAPLVPQLWSLRLTDPADLMMAGLSRAQVPVSMPSGRAVRTSDGLVGQWAVIGDIADGAAQVSALRDLVAQSPPVPPGKGPKTFQPLPRSVSMMDLEMPDSQDLLFGAGGDTAAPVGVPAPAGSLLFAVLGPPRSGRSTVLHTLTAAARALGWFVLAVDPSHADDPTSLEQQLDQAQGPALVTLDGLGQVTGTALEDVLETWLDSPPAGPADARLLAVSGDAEDFGSFRGLGARSSRHRTGLILQPGGAADGAPLGVAVPTGAEPLPGRGVLVLQGQCTWVQVAQP